MTVDRPDGFGMHEGDAVTITRAARPLRLVRSTAQLLRSAETETRVERS